MAKKGIEAGKAYIKAFWDDTEVKKGITKMSDGLKSFGGKLQTIGKGFGAVGASLTAPFVAAVKVFSDLGSELADISARTGLSAEALSELKFAAEQSGTSVEALEKGVRGMGKLMLAAEEGSKGAADTLADLGLTVAELQGKRPEEQFKLFADAIANVEDPGRRAALAMQVFGKSGSDLLPMMSSGAKGIEELQQQARDLGITLSTEDVAAAEKFGDQLDILKTVGLAKLFEIGAAVGPMLGDLAERMASNGRAVGEWIKENKSLVAWIFKLGAAVTGIGAVLTGAGIAITGVATAMTALTAASGALTASLPFLGAALGAVAIGYFAYQVYQATDAMKELNKQRQIGANLNDRMGDAQGRRRSKVTKDAAQITDPNARKAFLADALAMAEKEATGAKHSAGGAQKRVDSLIEQNVGWTGRALATDGKLIDEAEEEAKVAAANAEAAAKHADLLRDMLDSAEREAKLFSATQTAAASPVTNADSAFLTAWNAGVDKLTGGIQGAAETVGLVAPSMSTEDWARSLLGGGDPEAEAPEAPEETATRAAATALNTASLVRDSSGAEALFKALQPQVTGAERTVAAIDRQTEVITRQHNEQKRWGRVVVGKVKT